MSIQRKFTTGDKMEKCKNPYKIIKNLGIKSSYSINNLGITLYDYVIDKKPKKIVEFGVLNGYSAICFAIALKKLGRGKVTCYDLWDKYDYNHGDIVSVQKTIDKLKLTKYIELLQGDIYEWSCKKQKCDLLHIDISNDASRIKKVIDNIKKYSKNKFPILFEGGTLERDLSGWNSSKNNTFITNIKNDIKYNILDIRFPGISIIEKQKNPKKITIETHETNTGDLEIYFKKNKFKNFIPRMIYTTSLSRKTSKGPILHYRRKSLLSIIEKNNNVYLEYYHKEKITKIKFFDLNGKNQIYIPERVPIKIINDSNDTIHINTITNRAWTKTDPDTIKWNNWDEFMDSKVEI